MKDFSEYSMMLCDRSAGLCIFQTGLSICSSSHWQAQGVTKQAPSTRRSQQRHNPDMVRLSLHPVMFDQWKLSLPTTEASLFQGRLEWSPTASGTRKAPRGISWLASLLLLSAFLSLDLELLSRIIPGPACMGKVVYVGPEFDHYFVRIHILK
ncbi:hypothetical protein BO82DRAFT_58576 [Aspergillus uvarum CBS 121591]|uniref:Uncharacterized protein n=1 Tax=Aspergillus uvarum CBS 121591 TaxID=1448315 RepID=A0A319CEF9_9EURO|nr:hypothetical protein BO82DRAFT_58576 [Aspergillus uvarum CBS 121591]PYH82870.1 hypothetical protein BO82DRAFT_58576 [Aspergillus uvarum CBS 121591]